MPPIYRVGLPSSVNPMKQTSQAFPEADLAGLIDPVKLTVSISHHDSLPPLILGKGAAFYVVDQLTARDTQSWETSHSLCCCQPSGALRCSLLCNSQASLLCRPNLTLLIQAVLPTYDG